MEWHPRDRPETDEAAPTHPDQAGGGPLRADPLRADMRQPPESLPWTRPAAGAGTALLADVTVPDSAPPAAAGRALLRRADAALRAGADMLDCGGADASSVAAVIAHHPDVAICADADNAAIVRDAATARRTGARLICVGLSAAAAAADTGVRRDNILVAVPVIQLKAVLAAGWTLLADVDTMLRDVDTTPGDPPTPVADALCGGAGDATDAASLAPVEAAAAICVWLGVAVVRTRHVSQVRRALDMTAAVLGRRPPAWAVRGLA